MGDERRLVQFAELDNARHRCDKIALKLVVLLANQHEKRKAASHCRVSL